jgi:hypothetical protein
MADKTNVPRLEYLRVQNYRTLRDLELKNLTPLTVFCQRIKSGRSGVLYRDEPGFTQAVGPADIPGISEFMAEGAVLGSLWAEGYFGLGDPLTAAGNPTIQFVLD